MTLPTTGAGPPTAPSGAAPQNPLLNGLMAFYRFDDDVNDSSSNARNLTTSDATYTTGLIGDAIATGTANNQSWATGINWSTSPWSMSVWLNLPSPVALNTGGKVQLSVVNDLIGSIFSESNAGSNYIITGQFGDTPQVVVQSPAWVHIVITWNGSLGILYTNGSLTSSNNATIPSGTGAVDVTVNPDVDYATPFDLFGIWSRALTPDEVSQLYNSGEGLDPTA